MKTYHISGMGVQGCATAWLLSQRGDAFTWDDIDSPTVAWRASGGLIFPSGERRDDYNVWGRWVRNNEALWRSAPNARLWTEIGAFWTAAKTTPNSGRDQFVAEIGPLRRAERPSFHLNVPAFVEGTRAIFADRRLSAQDVPSADNVRTIVAHGYTNRLHHYVWGWTARARLLLDHRIVAASNGLRPTFYLRLNKFRVLYCKPMPGTPEWIIGTAHRATRSASPIQPDRVEVLIEQWRAEFIQRTAGLARVVSYRLPVQGWRPAPYKDDPDPERPVRVTLPRNEIVCPSLAGDGVRFLPTVLGGLAALLDAEENSAYTTEDGRVVYAARTTGGNPQ